MIMNFKKILAFMLEGPTLKITHKKTNWGSLLSKHQRKKQLAWVFFCVT